MKRICILTSLTVLLLIHGVTSFGQSKSFKMGQWTEIQGSILRELNRNYVDSLQLDRIMRAGIDAMLEELDPYTIYVPQEEQDDFEMMINKSYGGIGAIIQKKVGENVVINEPYYASPAWKNGLSCGDEIMEIDGEDTKPLTSKEASDKMKGKPGTTVVFKVKKVRSGDIVKLSIVREKIHLPDIEYTGMLDPKTGYILQAGFTEGVAESIKKSVLALKKKGMERLVLDLRGNGGGLMSEAINIVSLFVPKGTLVVTAKGQAEGSYREYKTASEPIDTEIPIIVMIDGGSASASEIVSGALQDLDRATIMGVRSYGKGLVQNVRPIAYNGQLKVTVAKYYTPSGRCVQARDYKNRNEDGSVGVIPDSLTHEFTTAHGRKVRDGGGITPDVVIPFEKYSRLIYSLVLNGIVESYAIEFCRKHGSIPAIEEFRLSDEDFEAFVQYALEQKFDYRSSAKALFDQMKEELKEDGVDVTMTAELDALEKALDIDKAAFIRQKKDEIVPFIEEEVAVRYYYQEAGVKVRLRYDKQLQKALQSPMVSL